MALLSFSQSFTKAEDYFQTQFEAVLNFFSNNDISLPEMGPSFRVSQNDPFDVYVQQLFRGDLSGEGTE
jgi:hypothetical protein